MPFFTELPTLPYSVYKSPIPEAPSRSPPPKSAILSQVSDTGGGLKGGRVYEFIQSGARAGYFIYVCF